MIPGAHWPASLAELVSPRFSKRTCLKINKVKREWRDGPVVKHLFLLQRPRVRFLTPVKRLTTICNSTSRWNCTPLLASIGTACTRCLCIQADKTFAHKIKLNL